MPNAKFYRSDISIHTPLPFVCYAIPAVRYHSDAGTVQCVAYAPDLAPGLLITGSADRTVRTWAPWGRDLSKACVQV
jgi:hypothetical protein